MQLKLSPILISITMCVLLSIGCSQADSVESISPIEPITHESNANSEHLLAGLWNISFDPVNSSVEAIPVRDAAAHYNITHVLLPPNCSDCLQLMINSFDPVSHILDIDVTVKNPTTVSVYDMRGIFHTNDAGHLLQNYDEWTALYDMTGGDIINPFKAFAKDQSGRLFGPGAVHTENYLILVPDPPDYYMITYAITVSWPGNCNEPYKIDNFTQMGLLYDSVGSDAGIQVDVFDWQDDTNQVKVSVPDITGEEFTPLSLIYATTWGTTLTNNTGAPPGEYDVKIVAGSANSGTMELIDFATVTVTEGVPANPIDVTPPNLHIENALGIAVKGGYAYVADYEQGLVIVDIDPLPDAHIVSIVHIAYAWDVGLYKGFAYVIPFEGDRVWVCDVNTPEAAYLACSAVVLGARDIAFKGNNAYVASTTMGLYIMDILNPMAIFGVQTIPLGGQAFAVAVEGDYAIIANRYGNAIQFVNISYGGYGWYEGEVPWAPGPYDIEVHDGLAYVTCWGPEFGIFDVDPWTDAHIINEFPLAGGRSMGLDVSGGYAYLGNVGPHLEIADIDPPEAAHTITTTPTSVTPWKVAVQENYAYVADGEGGLRIFQLW